MTTGETKALTRRFFEEVFNQGNLDTIDELVAEDLVDHEELPEFFTGTHRDKLKQFVTMWRTGFSDANVSVEDLICEGDKVVARLTFSGTHSGDFLGIPATGKPVAFTIIDILRVVDDKAVEHWGVSDTAGMLQQLGMLPSPEAAPI